MNGWKNYETWNVALWIQNDFVLYHLARGLRHAGYKAFAAYLQGECDVPLTRETPDGVSWTHPDLDYEALDEMMGEL